MYFFVFQVSSLNAAVLSVLVGVSNRRHLYPPMFQSIQFCEENVVGVALRITAVCMVCGGVLLCACGVCVWCVCV